MASGDWNYMAGRLTGDGHIEVIEPELPINVSSVTRGLSAPSAMSATILNPTRRLMNGGRPVFEPWNTVILAEAAGNLKAIGVYQPNPTFVGEEWSLTLAGLPSYAIGMPYTDSKYFIEADPLDIFRHIWTHLQAQPRGNLGITIDQLTSPVRVGKQVENVNFQTQAGEQVAFEAGPRKLNWWDTTNLGKEIDDYAKETPFDWLETVSWDGDEPRCHIKLGYPTIGGRKTGPRLVLGENLATIPSVTETDYASEALVVGAGEGRDSVRGAASRNDSRIRRVKVVEDKSKKSKKAANALASETLARTNGEFIVEEVTVYDHPNYPLESIEPGDEVTLYAETDIVLVDQWVRVVSKTETPAESNVATLTIVRSTT